MHPLIFDLGEIQIGSWAVPVRLPAYGLFMLLASEVHLIIKIATGSALVGGAILLWNTVRLNIRTAKFDRYRGVVR